MNYSSKKIDIGIRQKFKVSRAFIVCRMLSESFFLTEKSSIMQNAGAFYSPIRERRRTT